MDREAGAMTDPGPQPQKVHITEQPVAVVRERVPMDLLTGFFGRAFGAVMAAVQVQGASPAGPPFARYPAACFPMQMPLKPSTRAPTTAWEPRTTPSGKAWKRTAPPRRTPCGST